MYHPPRADTQVCSCQSLISQSSHAALCNTITRGDPASIKKRQRLKVKSQKSKVKRQKAKVKSQKSKVKSQKSKVKSQKAKGKSQKWIQEFRPVQQIPAFHGVDPASMQLQARVWIPV